MYRAEAFAELERSDEVEAAVAGGSGHSMVTVDPAGGEYNAPWVA